jgi:hypothetical protein
MQCELSRYSNGQEDCGAQATHRVSRSVAGETTARHSELLCAEHASEAVQGKHVFEHNPDDVKYIVTSIPFTK